MSLLAKARMKAQATNWNEDGVEGAEIEGVIVSVDERVGYEGALYLAYLIESTDESTGDVSYQYVHAFHKTLEKDLNGLIPGDSVAVIYNGTRKPKSGKGKDYHHYTVYAARQERAGESFTAPALPGDDDPFAGL